MMYSLHVIVTNFNLIYFTLVDCGTPPTVENGAFVPPSNTLMNATVTYTCNAGYEIVRDEAITCQADGVWTTAPGCSLGK